MLSERNIIGICKLCKYVKNVLKSSAVLLNTLMFGCVFQILPLFGMAVYCIEYWGEVLFSFWQQMFLFQSLHFMF